MCKCVIIMIVVVIIIIISQLRVLQHVVNQSADGQMDNHPVILSDRVPTLIEERASVVIVIMVMIMIIMSIRGPSKLTIVILMPILTQY